MNKIQNVTPHKYVVCNTVQFKGLICSTWLILIISSFTKYKKMQLKRCHPCLQYFLFYWKYYIISLSSILVVSWMNEFHSGRRKNGKGGGVKRRDTKWNKTKEDTFFSPMCKCYGLNIFMIKDLFVFQQNLYSLIWMYTNFLSYIIQNAKINIFRLIKNILSYDFMCSV